MKLLKIEVYKVVKKMQDDEVLSQRLLEVDSKAREELNKILVALNQARQLRQIRKSSRNTMIYYYRIWCISY